MSDAVNPFVRQYLIYQIQMVKDEPDIPERALLLSYFERGLDELRIYENAKRRREREKKHA